MKVSIIIKALNEEDNIVRAIESSLLSLKNIESGEIIISDSLSSDSTVDIAKKYPVKIVQLINEKERSCGVSAELGYRIANGEYIFIIDADMVLQRDFLETAIKELDKNNNLAGIGGIIQEMNIENAEFRGRATSIARHLQPGVVDRLNGGGLFRKSAIDKLGYLTNINLHAFEEYELGLRLRDKGWTLKRLDMVSVKHYGHINSSFSLLWKRWKGRYSWGAGELLREALDNNCVGKIIKEVGICKRSIMVFVWWLTAIVLSILSLYFTQLVWLVVLLLLTPLVVAAIRRRSLVDGIYLFLFFNIYAAGTIAGFFANKRINPSSKIEMKVIQ